MNLIHLKGDLFNMYSKLPEVGFVFDVSSTDFRCKKNTVNDQAIFFNCDMPEQKLFRAAPASDSIGNKFIEDLRFINILVVENTCESYIQFQKKLFIQATAEEELIDFGVKVYSFFVPYSGSDIKIHLEKIHPSMERMQSFSEGSKVVLHVNYIVPDLDPLKIYVEMTSLIYRRFSEIYGKIEQNDSNYILINKSIKDGEVLINLLLDS